MNLTISLAQLNIQLAQPRANLALASTWISEAAQRGSQLILLPELWTSGYDLSNARAHAETNRGEILPQLASLAQEHQVAVGGSLLLEQDGKVFNTFVFLPADGEEPAFYAKIHLFRLMAEDRWLSPGNHLQHVHAGCGEAGLAVCNDLRFPEMFRRYSLAVANLFLISAEWPLQRIAHWQTLLRARAIENQCFVAATNCTGVTGAETFGGCSAVISPWGETLVEGTPDQLELLTTTIDLDQVSKVRQRIPILQDRRPDLYGDMVKS